jgi:hypothetical protein
MAQKFTKADFYLLVFIMRWWRDKEIDPVLEEFYRRDRERWNLEDPTQDLTKLTDLTRKVLETIRSYPPEESDEDSEIEAGSEGEYTDSSEEENESVLANN